MTERTFSELERFLAGIPVYEYRLLDPAGLITSERVRIICREECERYDTTWACPPAVGSLEECRERMLAYEKAFFFSGAAQTPDILDLSRALAAGKEHERLTELIDGWFTDHGFDTLTLSARSCDICKRCTWPDRQPCRFPDRCHPCVESYGLVVSEIAGKEGMEFDTGGDAVLWFSLILLRASHKNAGVSAL